MSDLVKTTKSMQKSKPHGSLFSRHANHSFNMFFCEVEHSIMTISIDYYSIAANEWIDNGRSFVISRQIRGRMP